MNKRTTISLAILTVALTAMPSFAAGPNKDGEAGGRKNQERRRGASAERDPAQLVARMMKQFDKDNDQKLDATELTALLKSMQQRRGMAGRGIRPDGESGPRKGAQGRRRAQDGEALSPGGDRPKRPTGSDA